MENKNSILLYCFDISTLGLFQSRANLSKIQEETDGMWETKVQTPGPHQAKSPHHQHVLIILIPFLNFKQKFHLKP